MPLVVIEEDIRDSYNSKYSQLIDLKNSLNSKREEHCMLDDGLRGSQFSAEETLKGYGALGYRELENLVFNRKDVSQRSGSMRSEDEKPDMFGKRGIIQGTTSGCRQGLGRYTTTWKKKETNRFSGATSDLLNR